MRNFLIIGFALLIKLSFAQSVEKKSVVIGTMADRPNALLILNPPNNDQGVLLPQLTSAQRESIQPQSPADDGLIVFDTNDKIFYFWKQGQWIKGLGNDDDHQVIQYNQATHHLSLNLDGGEVDLTSLKEFPDVTGQAGKFITTNGASITWASLPAGSQLTGIIAGQGLSGGGTAGNVNLSINTDNSSIDLNGSNALELRNGGVTTAKLALQAITPSTIQPGPNNTVLATDNAGAVKWTVPVVSDNQNLSLSSNVLSIDRGTAVNLNSLNAGGSVFSGPLNNLVLLDNTIGSAKIIDGSITSADIKDGDLGTADIANNAITAPKILAGANNTVLTTDGTGTVKWIAPAIATDNQNLSLATNVLSIDRGTPVNLNGLTAGGTVMSGPLNNLVLLDNTINSAKIIDGSLSSSDVANNAITTAKIAPGINNTVLTTDGTGVVKWIAPVVSTDNQQLSYNSITQQLSLQNSTAADLSTLKELPTATGNAGKFLTTNGTTASWSDLNSGGQLSGTLNNLIINNDVIKTNNILDGTVQGADLASSIAINTTGNLNVSGTTNLTGPANVNSLLVSSNATFNTLTGATTRMVVVNPSGVLSSQVLPSNPATGNLTSATSGVTITNGTNAVIGSGSSISIQTASTSQAGLLSSTDFTSFNNKIGQTTTPGSGDISGSYNTGFQVSAGVIGDNEISAVSPNKISQAGATTGQVLKWNGSAWAPQADASIPTLSTNQIVTNDGTANVARTLSGDATLNGSSGAISITTTAGNNIVTAVNNASTTGTINTNRLNTAVVLDTESPASGSVSGSFVSGLTLNNNSVTTPAIAAQAVDATRIKPGTSNQVLVTDAAGTNAVWVNQSSLPGAADGSVTNELITNIQLASNVLTVTEAGTDHTQNLNSLTLTGDVTGTLNTSKVTKLQGVAISTTAPTDQQVLLYSNTAAKWVPTTVPGVSSFTAFKVAQASNQNVNGTDQLNWDSEFYDDGLNFGSNQFKAPTAGLYHFDALITIQGLDKDNVVIAILRVGAFDVQRSVSTPGSRDNDISSIITTDVKLNANDIVTVWVNIQGGKPGPGPGGAFSTKGGLTSTQFSGRKIY